MAQLDDRAVRVADVDRQARPPGAEALDRSLDDIEDAARHQRRQIRSFDHQAEMVEPPRAALAFEEVIYKTAAHPIIPEAESLWYRRSSCVLWWSPH